LKKAINFFKKYWFTTFVIIAILIKYILNINMPINVRDSMGADEYLMLAQAESLIKGEYLGTYNYLTLVKGIGFPLFLALAFKLGFSYLALYSIFYSFSCLIALLPLKKLIKNKVILYVIFLVLLFCPATFDDNVTLMYRNMLIVPQSILLISSIMMMYFNLNNSKKKFLFWTLLSSFTWIFLWHTREDSIWSFPLVLIASIVMLIILIISKIKNKKQKIAILSLPFIILFLSIQVISLFNYKYYGIYTVNQLNDSNYTKAVMLMMKVKPEKEIEHVEITRETLNRLYDVSPTFANLKEIIEYDYENNGSMVIAEEDNGEINEDLITWELTGAANALGYYETAQKAEEFWGKVYDEILSAINAGLLETRSTLPSRSLIPLPKGNDTFKKLFESITSLFIKSVRYDYNIIKIDKTSFDEEIIRRYETISGSYVVREDQIKLSINGYAFAKSSKNSIYVDIENSEGQSITADFSLNSSDDIYNNFLSLGSKYKNAKKAKYDETFYLNKDDFNDLYLVVRDKNGKKMGEYSLNELENYYETNYYILQINNYSAKEYVDPMISRSLRHVRIGNTIKRVYSVVGVPLLITSLIYYVGLTVVLITNQIKKKDNLKCFSKWVFLSAILGSIFVLLCGLGYVNAFMVNVKGYISGSCGMLNMFMIVSLALLIQDLICFVKNIKNSGNGLKVFNKIFINDTDNIFLQLLRYGFVGGIAAVVNIGMLYVFTDILSINYILGNVISFILGLIVNYILSKKTVFKKQTSISKSKEFILYALIGVLGLGVDTLLLWIFTDKMNMYYMVSKIISTILVFIWNFGARKVLYKIVK